MYYWAEKMERTTKKLQMVYFIEVKSLLGRNPTDDDNQQDEEKEGNYQMNS